MVELYSVYMQECGGLSWLTLAAQVHNRKLGSAGDDGVVRMTHSSPSVPSHGTKFKLIFDERTVLPIAARG